MRKEIGIETKLKKLINQSKMTNVKNYTAQQLLDRVAQLPSLTINIKIGRAHV